MKKVLAITIVAALMLCATAAMATEANWQLVIKASDLGGSNFNNTVSIGCVGTFTDGKDSAKGEPGSLGSPTVGKIIASAGAVFADGAIGSRDFKQPITEAGSTAVKTWTIKLYTLANQNTAPLNGFKVAISLGASPNTPVYTIGGVDYEYVFTAPFISGGEKIYDATNMMPSTFSFDVATASIESAADYGTLQITARPVVPEPSSMLALASGLFGMAGFAIRRRK